MFLILSSINNNLPKHLIDLNDNEMKNINIKPSDIIKQKEYQIELIEIKRKAYLGQMQELCKYQ